MALRSSDLSSSYRTLKILKHFVLQSLPARHIWFVGTEFGADSSADEMSIQRVERTLNRYEFDTTCPDIKSSLPIGDKK